MLSVDADLAKAQRFLHQAQDALGQLGNITSVHVQFDVAYNACQDIGEAVLALYGSRTAPGPGAHVAVGEFLSAVFDEPPGLGAAQAYDTLRVARNGLRYRAQSPSLAHAQVAIKAAQALIAAADQRFVR